MRDYPLLLILVSLVTSNCSSRIERLPIDPADRTQAHRLTLEGDNLLREGKDHLALAAYVEASTLNPYSELIFNKLAIAYSRIMMFPQAQNAVQRSIRLNKGYAYAHNTQGIIYLATKKPKKAAACFRRAIRLQPEALFYLNLANSYVHQGQYDRARSSLEEALQLDPDVMEMDHSISVSAQAGTEDSRRFYEMAVLFAELESKEACLAYLRQAFKNGFDDARKIRHEAALQKYLEDEEFMLLLAEFNIQIGTL